MNRSRRLLVVQIPMEWLIDSCFTAPAGEFISVVRFKTLPQDCHVEAVSTAWETRCVEVLLSHDSFAEVADGEPVPRLYLPEDKREVYRAAELLDGDAVPIYVRQV